MTIEAYIWTSISIPEMLGHPYVTVPAIEKIQALLNADGLGPKWHRQEDWLYFHFENGTSEKRRLVLHQKIYVILTEDSAGRAGARHDTVKHTPVTPSVFWRGAVTRIYEARAMNEEITSP